MQSSDGIVCRVGKALAGPALLVVLIVVILRRALFSGGHLLPVWPNADLTMEYLPWRYFGFSQWKQGHFPFWNPHVFCGNPFFAQIQSCLLYPIAWVNFLFNAATATTVEIALDLCAGAICTYAWARQRKISRCGSALAGGMFAFSGPFYQHVTVGYLTVLATLAWMPLVFLALDRLLVGRFGSAMLIGAAAVCLQCLGGHAQLVYYTFLVAGLYVVLQSIGQSRTMRVYAGFVGIYVLGGMLAAVQLLPGYLANNLTVRAGGTSYAYSSTFSLPPENLLTILIPYPLGNMTTVPYLGRWYIWETTVYAGIVGLLLACIGIAEMERSKCWRMIALLAAILVLTLGSYTPMYRLFYQCLPGFNSFRGAAKFGSLWALMLAILAGHGWDRISRRQVPGWALMLTFIGAVVCALLAVTYQFNSADSPINALLRLVADSGEFYVSRSVFSDPQIQRAAANWLGWQWYIAAGLMAATCLLLCLRRFSVNASYVLLALAIADVYLAAASCSPIVEFKTTLPPQWTLAATSAAEHDQRLLFTSQPYDNSGDIQGYDSVWGYDTGQPRRYTELIAASQGQHLMAVEYYFSFQHVSRIFQLLRCRDILLATKNNPVLAIADPMPHLRLLGNYIRMNDTAAIATRLLNDFDFQHSAILETDPHPAPTPAGAAGHARLLRQSINDLEIEADLPAPALLLVTDAYAPGWHVRPMEINRNQATYEVLQADDVLRAIPLAAGHHHFDLYYLPPGLRAGVGVSALGWGLWIVGVIGLLFRKPRRSHMSA